jgi:hypothetical protein
MGKLDSPVLHSGCSSFYNFIVKIKKGDNTKKSGIQVCLRHGKGEKNIKESKQRRLEPKAEAAKTECSDLGFWTVQFFLNR